MNTIKRAAAGFCSLIVLLGNAGFSAVYAADPEAVLIKADQVQAEPGETVSYSISLEGLETAGGYAASGILLTYDESLEPEILGGTVDVPVYETGKAAAGMTAFASADPEKHTIAAGTMGEELCTADGTYMTFRFHVPEDAKRGDIYAVHLTVDQWLDENGDALPFQTEDGWIKLAPPPLNGSCGEDLRWTLNDAGALTITGTGYMENYADDDSARSPWYERRDEIETVSISPSAEYIGDYAFADCTALETVTLPESVSSVGTQVFSGCDALTDIYIRNDECVIAGDTIPAAVTVHGAEGSSAERYAAENGLAFQPITAKSETTTTFTETESIRTTTSTTPLTSDSAGSSSTTETSTSRVSASETTSHTVQQTTSYSETTRTTQQTESTSTTTITQTTVSSVSSASVTVTTTTVTKPTETTVSTGSSVITSSTGKAVTTTASTSRSAATTSTTASIIQITSSGSTHTTAETTVTTSPDTLPGDLNLDGSVNESDLTLLKAYIAKTSGLTGQGLRNADLNLDGSVDAKDEELLSKTVQEQTKQTTSGTSSTETTAAETVTSYVTELSIAVDPASQPRSFRFTSEDQQPLDGINATISLFQYCVDAENYLLDADGKPLLTAEGRNIQYDPAAKMTGNSIMDRSYIGKLTPKEELNSPAKLWEQAESPESGQSFTVYLYYQPDESVDAIFRPEKPLERAIASYDITIDEVLRGDANGDHSVDSIDATIVLQLYTAVELSYQDFETREREIDGKKVTEYAVGIKPNGETNWSNESVFYYTCDIDGDKKVTTTDAMAILIHYTSNDLAHVPLTWEEILNGT